jgi:cytochrome c-type biogenesis protein CcmH/NrfG
VKRSGGRKQRSTSRASTALAVIVILFLAFGTVAGILASRGGGSTNTSDSSDAPAKITPGAEVNRLETQVAQDPSNVETVSVLANVLANSGRIAESVPWFQRAIDLSPTDEQLRLAFGRALARNGSAFDAELQLKKAVELAPDDPVAAFNLAELYDSMSPPRVDDARSWYQKVVDLAPDSVPATQARDRLAALDATPGAGSPVATP